MTVTALLMGGVCAASVNDFKLDSNYKSIYSGEYYSVSVNGNQDAGLSIYKNVNDILSKGPFYRYYGTELISLLADESINKILIT